ncbi:MAG: Mur ligase domain-containing protein [Gammaproteobacteria bacterium]|nr:Mur ligase domain-containing protein [Gammaproteobacteria bacterium]
MHTQELARLLTGEPFGDNVEFRGASTDTRKLQGGELFIALRGPHFDGHDFMPYRRYGRRACRAG